jgi:DNA-binding MarR family transcriptional regulator
MKYADQDLLADLSRFYGGMRRWFDRAMMEQGASLAKTKLLIVIQHEGGKLRAADIAGRFGVAPRTVTEALDALEREGLVVRTQDPDDRRVKRLTITPAGEAAVAVTEPLRQRLAQEILSVLDDEERKNFHGALLKLLHCVGID